MSAMTEVFVVVGVKRDTVVNTVGVNVYQNGGGDYVFQNTTLTFPGASIDQVLYGRGGDQPLVICVSPRPGQNGFATDAPYVFTSRDEAMTWLDTPDGANWKLSVDACAVIGVKIEVAIS